MFETADFGPVQVNGGGVAVLEKPLVRVTIERERDAVFIDFDRMTQTSDVLDAIKEAEQQGVGFDLLDPDLWEYPEWGFRIHGFFVADC